MFILIPKVKLKFAFQRMLTVDCYIFQILLGEREDEYDLDVRIAETELEELARSVPDIGQ